MSKEILVQKFNEMFPVGGLVYWRSIGADSVSHLVYTVEAPACIQNDQAVAWLEERSGMVSIEENFVDYSQIPQEKPPLEKYDLCEHVGPQTKVKLRRRCAKCQMEVDRVFDSFWSKLIYPNGELDVEEMKGNLIDYLFLMEQASNVYDHVTGGHLSKTNYYSESVIQEADKHLQKEIDEAVAENTQNIREDLKILQNCVDCVYELFGYQKDDLIDFVTFIPEDFRKMTSAIDQLKIALADAIRSPMGVLPTSAEGLISREELDAAEARMSGNRRTSLFK